MVSLSVHAQEAAVGGECGSTGNYYAFTAGEADYTVARDLHNDNGGWYVDTHAGEILTVNSKGQLCESTGTALKAGNAADRTTNQPMAPKCNGAITGPPKTDYKDGTGQQDNKDYQYKWVSTGKDSDGNDTGYLVITPYVNGRPSNPYVIIEPSLGSAKDSKGNDLPGNKKTPNLAVKISSIPTEDDPGGKSKTHTLNFNEGANGAGGSQPHVCTLGKINPDDKSQNWSMKNGLGKPDDDNKTTVADKSVVHQGSGQARR